MARSIGGELAGPVVTCSPKSGWTDPAKGDLVIWDTGSNYGVDECAADENPVGRVVSVNTNKDVLGVELFTPGTVVSLPYSGTPARGDKVEANGTTGQVRTDNTNGVGKIIAKDRISGYVDVTF